MGFCKLEVENGLYKQVRIWLASELDLAHTEFTSGRPGGRRPCREATAAYEVEFSLSQCELKEFDNNTDWPRSSQMGGLPSKAEPVEGRGCDEETKLATTLQVFRATRELGWTIPAPLDSIPGLRRDGRSLCCVVVLPPLREVAGMAQFAGVWC